jgi:pyruvate/2-oxoglutarate dehydrogenase complex dihydrolipoamide acyltransferase (E2) component
MDRQILPALQLEVVKLERHLGILARLARLRAKHMAHQLRTLGNLGSVGSLHRRLGLNHHAVARLGGL